MKKIALAYVFVLLAGIGSTVVSQATPQRCDIQSLAIEAALDDETAQYNLAVEFFRGECVGRDLAKAAALWKMAAEAGNIDAHNNLGYLKYYGHGIEKDHAEGVRLWRIAAENGFCESQIHLGEAYFDRKYLKRDLVEAFAWGLTGQKCAESLDPEMSKSIGEMATEFLSKFKTEISAAQEKVARQRASTYIQKYVGQDN